MRKIELFLTLIAAAALAGAGCSKAKKMYQSERADQLFASGQLAQAETEYLNVLRADPSNGRAMCQLGVIYFDEGRFQRAAAFLLKGSQMDTNNLETRVKLGQIYLAVGKNKEALDKAESMLSQNPRDPEAPLLLAQAVTPKQFSDAEQLLVKLSQTADSAAVETALGTLAIREHDFIAAQNNFGRALALDAQFADAYSALGDLFSTQGDLKKAEAAYQKAADFSPARSPQRLQFVQFEIQNGKMADAKKILGQMTTETPDYVPAWLALAEIALTEKKYDDCAAALKQALARDDGNFNALLLQGQLDLARGQKTAALAELSKLAGDYPEAPRVRFELALADFENSKTDEALTQLHAAINLDPTFIEANFMLAEIEIKSGNTDSAIALLRELLHRRPELTQAKLLLADALRVSGNLNGALDIYRDLEAKYPANPQIPLLMGSTFIEQKDDADARKEFELAQKIAPENLTAQEELAEVDLLDNEADSAKQRAEDLIAKNPNFPDAYVLLAKIYLQQGQTNQCEIELSKAIQLQPETELPYLLLAQLQSYAGQNQDAVFTLNGALEKNPTDAAALMLLGTIETAQKNDRAAANAYQKLLAANPQSVPALDNLACIYEKYSPDLDRAFELAQQARKFAPDNPSVADTFGWILFLKHDYSSAAKVLQESAAELPDEPEVQFHFGMAGYMLDDEENAQSAFQRANASAKIFPDRDECNHCLAILAVDPKTADTGARANLEKQISAQPDDPVALDRLVAMDEISGNTNQAVQLCQAALQANPKSVKAMVLLSQLIAAAQPQKAFDLAKAAYDLKPDSTEVELTLGRAAFANGNFQWSYNLLKDVAEKQPNDAQTLYDFAEAAFAEGKISDALTAMNGALAAGLPDSETGEAKNFVALLPLFQNPDQAVAAESSVDEILETNADYPPALLVSAVIAAQKGDTLASENAYEKLLGHFPDCAPAQKNLAILYAQNLVEPDKAYPLAIKARETFPDDPDVARALGLIVFEQGDYARAANLLQTISDSKSADAELFYCLGISEFHLKNFPASRTSLQRALTLNLSGEQAADARETLAELK